MLENKRSVTNKQMLMMVEELERDASLSFAKSLTTPAQDVKWQELVDKLNAVPNGAKRSVARWKSVLINWKLILRKEANTNENIANPEVMDELAPRLLRLMEEEELVEDLDIDLLPDLLSPEFDDENIIDQEPPQMRMFDRRARPAMAGLRHEPYMNDRVRRSQRSLKILFDNIIDQGGNPQKKVMQMQLDRLHSVSQQLESHIQDVQNRIQMIKDMWQHECNDD